MAIPNLKLAELLRPIQEQNLPAGLHARILRSAWFLKYRGLMRSITSLIFLNLAITGWWVINHFLENDTWYLLKTIWQNLEWNAPAINFVLSESLRFLPANLLLNLAVSLGLIVSGLYFAKSYLKILPDKGRFSQFNS